MLPLVGKHELPLCGDEPRHVQPTQSAAPNELPLCGDEPAKTQNLNNNICRVHDIILPKEMTP